MSGPVDLASIHATAARCKAEGIPLSETAIRRFVKCGQLPAVRIGAKALLYWPNVTRFVQEGNTTPIEAPQGAIRQISV